ncbi:TPA_asm: P3 [Sophora betacytorhabdovirus 1]|nr:TPA_asm: P3 [Sophora betacytorhabdovirus 1]
MDIDEVLQESGNNKTKLNDGKIFNMELKKQVIQNIVPHRVKWANLSRALNLNRAKSVRCESVIISYAPYMQNIAGSIVINLYDTRSENPRNKLLLHTSFPASGDQYIIMRPSIVYSLSGIEDTILLEVFSVGLELKNSSVYAHMKAKCTFASSTKRMKGDVPSLEAVPGLYYTRGDLLDAEEISKLTRQHGFIGPPLVQGASYVIHGAGAKSQIKKDFVHNKNSGDKYNAREIYEDSEIIV